MTEFYKNPKCPVPIVQLKTEFEELLDIYKSLSPKNILEIGSYFGGTLWHWISFSSSAQFTVVDKITATDKVVRCQLEMAHNILWQHWARQSNSSIEVFTGDSSDLGIIEQVSKRGQFDYIFIDGDHTYRGVKNDYQMYKPFVRAGGILVLHDIYESNNPDFKCIEVHKLWKEIVDNGHKVKELRSTGETVMGIGVVYL